MYLCVYVESSCNCNMQTKPETFAFLCAVRELNLTPYIHGVGNCWSLSKFWKCDFVKARCPSWCSDDSDFRWGSEMRGGCDVGWYWPLIFLNLFHKYIYIFFPYPCYGHDSKCSPFNLFPTGMFYPAIILPYMLLFKSWKSTPLLSSQGSKMLYQSSVWCW